MHKYVIIMSWYKSNIFLLQEFEVQQRMSVNNKNNWLLSHWTKEFHKFCIAISKQITQDFCTLKLRNFTVLHTNKLKYSGSNLDITQQASSIQP